MWIGCCTRSVFPPQKPAKRAAERDEAAIARWTERDWPRIKRLAHRWHAHLVFVDETGYLLTPLMRRTWAPVGQTPRLAVRMRARRKVSAIGAVTISPKRRRLGRYVEMHEDRSIAQGEVVGFLDQLRRHLRGPMVVLWDSLPAHKGRAVRAYLARHRWTLRAEALPAYAPELNPNEYAWGHDKGGVLANACPADVSELTARAEAAIGPTRSDQPLLRGFLRATGLPIRLE